MYFSIGENLGQLTATINLRKAVDRNRYYGVKLNWYAYLEQINPLLGFRSYSPIEETFAQAVANWQQKKRLEVDGILGPKTWAKMQVALDLRSTSSDVKEPKISTSGQQESFLERVLAAHIARSSRKRPRLPDLSKSQLAPVEGTNIQMRKDAAIAAGRLLAAANIALSLAKTSGDTDALRTKRITGISGYRSRSHQESLWRDYFRDKYYKKTSAYRAQLPGGKHGSHAVQYMVKYISPKIAAPGFSKHQAGLAIDFKQVRTKGNEVRNSTSSESVEKWKKTWFFNWLGKNAKSFGFYPYPKEPWHWIYKP